MSKELLDKLPSFLAYPLARYQGSELRSPRVLFQFLESLLLYVECLLRAQARDYFDLGRPGSLGIRTERILMLSKRLREAQVPLLVQFLEEERRDEDLSRLVTFRNRWVHGQGSDPDASVAPEPAWIELSVERLLWKVTPVAIDVFRTGPTGSVQTFRLQGLRGLFDAPMFHHDQLPAGLEDGALVACAPGFEPTVLWPFCISANGSLGENRVKMLARVVGKRKEYLDPLDLFGMTGG